MAEENLPGPGLAISDKGGLCRVFSPAAPIFVVPGTVVGTARQNISMVGCCRLPFGTASRSVRVLLKVPYLRYFCPLPRPSLDEKARSITVPVVVPRADLKALSGGQDPLHRLTSLLAHRGGLHQGKAMSRIARSWYSAQALPTLTRRRRTAPLDTPVMRTVEPTEQPSTKAEITAIFFAVLITFTIIKVY
jgi:hypothetical protein